ncbi:MucR family transcriptional regulator [Temperatibacter marinus]|uniref:MucR family transcriptional regulator n=1 Tax=Temperatibacter marinus TaxID=1456591 RepID=A0AA52ELD7_9PROT|nr:MucR family transcriptional regulator [Temperatibacter marinus]WND04151.1 MucR family transcriptional regulator [Temperatibacter marinus]
MSSVDTNKDELLEYTVDIVSSYVSNNSLPKSDLSEMITSVYTVLSELEGAKKTSDLALMPAVSVEESITDDYLVCLEDGKKLKLLKRHLKARYNMSPDDYRSKWGLPSSYPMVAPNYALRRRSLAKEIGLGKKAS